MVCGSSEESGIVVFSLLFFYQHDATGLIKQGIDVRCYGHCEVRGETTTSEARRDML